LAVALTVVPMIASRFLKAPNENLEEKRRQSKPIQWMEKATRWALGHRFLVLALTLLLLALGGLGMTTVGMQFLPATDESFFTIRVSHENGTSLETTEETVRRIEEVLAEENDIQDYFSLIGSTSSQGPVGASATNEAEIFVTTTELDQRERSTLEISEDLKKDVESAAGEADVSFNQQGSLGTEPNTLTFTIKADHEDRLDEAVRAIQEELSGLDNVNEVINDQIDTVEEIQITVDREKALNEGFVPAQVAQIVNQVTRGQPATQLTTEESDILTVNVKYDESVTENVDALKGLLLKKADGTFTTLGEVTTIERGESPVTINRDNQQPAVQFTVKYGSGATLSEITREVTKAIDDLDLPDEVELSFTGDQELLQDSLDELGLAFVLAVVFVYLVMAAQFESFKYPFVIILSIPLIVIGVMIALTATRTPLGVTAIIGLIILAGIVVNNAIVLVDYINQKKADGWRTYEAIVEAVNVRTRPIIMTATTTMLGLVPLALGYGEGAEIQQPLGITVIGGLVSSTFLTLFVIPVIYSLFDKETRHLNKKYVTPDGQLIPAYLLENKEKKTEVGRTSLSKEAEQEQMTKEDVIRLLEKIIEASKNERKDEE